MSSSLGTRVRDRGHHPGGRLTLRGIRRGVKILVVEPGGNALVRSGFHPFEVTDRGAPLQVIELARPVTRLLRVKKPNGEPVAGTRVELLEPISSHPIDLETHALTMERLVGFSFPDRAVTLMAGKTDGHGELLLRGPPHTALAVRILGPGHQPLVRRKMTLVEGAEPLLVVVALGATVTGRIGPARLLAQLWPRAETRARLASGSKASQQLRKRYLPGIVLVRRQGGKTDRFGDRRLLDEAGAFEITGIPPGTWDAYLAYTIDQGGGASTGGTEFIRTLRNLREGETRELILHLDHLVRGRVTGRVLMNGKAIVHGRVQLVGKKPDGKGGVQQVSSPQVKLSEVGAFSLQVTPATYRLIILTQVGKPPRLIGLPPPEESVTVGPGQSVNQVFHVRSGVLRIRVLGSEGKPLAGVQLQVGTAEKFWLANTPKTDAQGWTSLDPAPVGALILTATPKYLLDQKAMSAFYEAHRANPDAWRQAMIPLGQVSVRAAAEPTEIEVRMPAGSGF